LTAPVGAAVAVVVAVAWYVTWATSDFGMTVLGVTPMEWPAAQLAAFFAITVVMMVAMMLPSALPMILAYAGMTRMDAGRPTRPTDVLGTVLFVVPYFFVWGAFGVAALLGAKVVGLAGVMSGPLAFAPAVVLLAAGGWQATRTKEVCLNHCQSPMGFVMHHWRSGRLGAVRMGVRHASYCIGCCWLFMVVLVVAGAMSLFWMGTLAVAIFAEKVGTRPRATSLAIGVLLLSLGGPFAFRAALGT
jgi:predicted metal-binding membrane protein